MLKSLKNRTIKLIAVFFICVVIGFMIMITTYVFYLWYTYIDKTITSGQAYGFVIGDDKFMTYENTPGNLAKLKGRTSTVYIEIKSDVDSAKLLAVKPNHLVMVEALLHDVGYPVFKSKNQWDFYIDGSYFNKLSLRFCDEKLCEIYRHRKYFELP